MTEPAIKKTAYEDLYNLPANMTGQIIEGELYALPRPHYRHSKAASALGSNLQPPYQFGRGGGPGGWIILSEVEIMLGENLLVPDWSGWKRERLPKLPKGNWATIVPDWICEIISPSTLRLDKNRKMPLYAQYGLAHLWLIDPLARLLEVFKLENGRWVSLGNFLENDKVRAEPFLEIEIDLSDLWEEEE